MNDDQGLTPDELRKFAEMADDLCNIIQPTRPINTLISLRVEDRTSGEVVCDINVTKDDEVFVDFG